MSETESGGRESRCYAGIGKLVISGIIGVLLQDEVVPLHDFFAEDHGQELIVGDVLDNGGVDVTGLLEECLVVPVGVDDAQLCGKEIVVSYKHCVNCG